MSKLKKCLSYLLVISLLVSGISVSASGDEYLAFDEDFSAYDSTNSVSSVSKFDTLGEGAQIGASGDGKWVNSTVNNGTTFFPYISDDFSSSTSYTSSNKLSFLSGTQNTITQSDTHKWVTSDVHFGKDPANSKVWIDSKKLCLYAGNASQAAVALMDIGDKKINDITKVSFDVINPDTQRQAAHVYLLVDSTQKKSYSFSMGTDGYWEDYNKRTTRVYTPYVRKWTDFTYDGSTVSDAYTYSGPSFTADNSTAPTLSTGTKIQWSWNSNQGTKVITTICGPWDNGSNYFGYQYSKAHWDVEFNKSTGVISWTVTVTSSDGNKVKTWSDSIVDSELSTRMEECKYPVALAVQTHNMTFSNVNVHMSVEGEDSPNSIDGVSFIDTENDKIGVGGSEESFAHVNYETASSLAVGSIKKIKFTTEREDKFIGASLLKNEAEDCYYVLGQRDNTAFSPFAQNDKNSYAPVILKVKNGEKSIIAADLSSRGWSASNKKIDWEIDIIKDEIIYKATGDNLVVWEGKFIDEDLFGENCKYLISATGLAKEKVGGYLKGISFKSGEYFSGGMGEPKNAFYADLAEGKTPDENNVITLDNFKDYAVRKVIAFDFADMEIQLSEDNISYDTITLDENGEWVNTQNEKAYRYVKLPFEPIDSVLVFADESTGTFDIEKKKTRYFYPVIDGEIPVFTLTEANFVVEDTRIATVDKYGNVEGILDGETILKVEKKDGSFMKINIRVVSALTKALESGDAAVMAAYVKTQDDIIKELNNYIKAKNENGIKIFMTSKIKEIDAISEDEILKIDDTALQGLAKRLATYPGNFEFSELDDIYDFEDAVIREIRTGLLNNISDKDDFEEILNTNSDVLDIDVENKYYKGKKSEILKEFLDREFENYNKLVSEFKEKYVMINYKDSTSPSFIATLIDDCIDEIGYNEDYYDEIEDKTLLAKTLISQKSSVDSIEDLKDKIDTYTPSYNNTAQSSGSSSKGSSGGGGFSIKTPQVTVPLVDSTNTAVEKVKIFDDVETTFWAYEPIRYLVAKNIVSGYGDDTFKPNNAVTRAEFLKMVLEALTIETEIDAESLVSFEDVSDSEWYHKYVISAAQKGIVLGSGNVFMPNDFISREQMAVIVMKAVAYKGKSIVRDVEVKRFNDEENISDWALSYVLKLQAAGIVSGSDGNYYPENNASRAESAQIIYKTLSCFEEVAAE